MAGKPSFQFYPGDWLKDPALRGCSPATRGVWMDLICYAWNAEDEGRLNGTITRLARLCACSESEMQTALDELAESGTADVVRDGSAVTLTCRRVARDLAARRTNADRQARFRNAHNNASSNGHVTHDETPKCEVEEEDRRGKERGGAGGEGSPHVKGVPWQIAMYQASTGRAPSVGYWPAITAQVLRRDVWQMALDRADTDGWKAGNVNARVKEYLDTERTMYPRTPGGKSEAPKQPRATTCEACGKPVGADGGTYERKAYCGPCFDRAAWTQKPKAA